MLEQEQLPPYIYYQQQLSVTAHHFYINGDIVESAYYIDMFHMISQAGPDDIVHIHLNTLGGDLTTGIQLINAMRSSPAHIIASVEGEARSLGTLIFLAADQQIINDNCMLMFHDYSGGVLGKGNSEQIAQLQKTNQWFSDLAKEVYVPFLSEKEVDDMLNGKDYWMTTSEVKERLEKMDSDKDKISLEDKGL